MTENELKQRVLRLAYLNGWYVFHMTASPIRGSQGKGYPDLTLARDKEVMWFELKQQDGMMSTEQFAWSMQLPAYHVIRPKDLETGHVGELLGMTLGDVLQQMAYTLPIWRDAVVASLAGIVIGALWLYASLMGVE